MLSAELTTAVLRFPVAVLANATASSHNKKLARLSKIAACCVRIANNSLALHNRPYDKPLYAYLSIILDCASLVLSYDADGSSQQLSVINDNLESDDKELDELIKALHTGLLPFCEMSAAVYSAYYNANEPMMVEQRARVAALGLLARTTGDYLAVVHKKSLETHLKLALCLAMLFFVLDEYGEKKIYTAQIIHEEQKKEHAFVQEKFEAHKKEADHYKAKIAQLEEKIEVIKEHEEHQATHFNNALNATQDALNTTQHQADCTSYIVGKIMDAQIEDQKGFGRRTIEWIFPPNPRTSKENHLALQAPKTTVHSLLMTEATADNP